MIAAWVSDDVFERIPHIEDEFAYLWQAEMMAQGKISQPSPETPRAFPVPFVVDHDGQRFAKYPPGWPAALSIGARVNIPWFVNSLLAGLSLWFIYRLGTKILGRGVGLLAEFLTLSSPMFLMLSGSLLSHKLSLCLALVFQLAWLDSFPLRGVLREQRAPRWVSSYYRRRVFGVAGAYAPADGGCCCNPVCSAWNLSVGEREARGEKEAADSGAGDQCCRQPAPYLAVGARRQSLSQSLHVVVAV